MKNILIMLLTVSLLSPIPGTAEAGGTVSGLVSELTDDGFAILTDEGIRFIITSRATVWNAEDEIDVGDYVTVNWSGPTDRKSLNAETVTCRYLTGEVLEITDGAEPFFLLLPEGEDDPVAVDFGGLDPYSIAQGMTVTVYYSGIMTRSRPPRITAEHIRGLTVQGIVLNADETGILIMEGCSMSFIRITDDTKVLASLTPSTSVIAAVTPTMTLSIPPQYTATEILPAK